MKSILDAQSGQKKEETCFITCVVWSRQAEVCQQYLKKGRPVFIEGRLILRSWEVDGKPRSVMEVRADRVQFLGSSGAPASAGSAAEVPEPVAAEGVASEPSSGEGGADADVPF